MLRPATITCRPCFCLEAHAVSKLLVLLLLVLITTRITEAKLYTRVCRADGITPLALADPNIPFIYEDVMVGTRLTIIVSSDAGGEWSSDLTIEGDYFGYGSLSGRDYNDITRDWEGSRFEAAGKSAKVWEWEEEGRIKGCQLQGDGYAVPGDWFIIDYTAMAVGQCKVGFYDYNVNWDEPVYYHVFYQVPTRDFDGDSQVGFVDFALLAANWDRTDCTDPNSCGGTDLDSNGSVDSIDLMLFADYWLESTE